MLNLRDWTHPRREPRGPAGDRDRGTGRCGVRRACRASGAAIRARPTRRGSRPFSAPSSQERQHSTEDEGFRLTSSTTRSTWSRTSPTNVSKDHRESAWVGGCESCREALVSPCARAGFAPRSTGSPRSAPAAATPVLVAEVDALRRRVRQGDPRRALPMTAAGRWSEARSVTRAW